MLLRKNEKIARKFFRCAKMMDLVGVMGIAGLVGVIGFVMLGPVAAVHADDGGGLTIYSGRSKSLVAPVIKQFEKETGIKVSVRYGKTGQMLALLSEEGDQSPADVFWAQDAGALGAMTAAGRFIELPSDVTSQVSPIFRSPTGKWVATSGRARVLAYSPGRVKSESLPKSVMALVESKWAGRVGWAPTNASFQAFVTAMRQVHGDSATKAWLTAMKANGVKAYPKNTPIIQAIAAGEIDLGLPNHYYLLRFKAGDKNYPVAQTFFDSGDIGNLVNVAGAGVLTTSEGKKRANAMKFVAFLLSDTTQQYFTQAVFEYPLTGHAIVNPLLVSPEELLKRAPKVPLEKLEDLKGTQAMLREVGLI